MLSLICAATLGSSSNVYVDHGVIKWTDSGQEVRLFGANYCLPSALDYRAAGYVGADRKQTVRDDMTHFARMGWNGLRLSFWGDWECCDIHGNLIANDRLDLLDYTIATAKKRGIYMLLSPIVTYDARWPEMKEYPEAQGFSRFYDREKLGTDPGAIKAETNYLRQLLNHVNPYTGIALKEEANIPFIEMINEPWHHPELGTGYIDTLVQAVRDTGCQKLTFHNLSQDFRMAPILRDSKVDGVTFGWYPSGLNANHQLRGNFLPYVNDYPPMRDSAIASKPRIVYEFDLPDTITGYGYPAMVRSFRAGGAQFAAMFSYDMLPTAPTNLGWTTHLLNLVYTPKKAASAVIAAEEMKSLPSGHVHADYPSNCRFGKFRVSAEEDLAELADDTRFMYSNTTRTRPPSPRSLERVMGCGASPVVDYRGTGVYFLDRLKPGMWRLEVYPDVIQVADPFNNPGKDRPDFKLVRRTLPMRLSLPDLGSSFAVEGLDTGNDSHEAAEGGRFDVRPGVYLLRSKAALKLEVPDHDGEIGLREFVCPSDSDPSAVPYTFPKPPADLFDPQADRPMLAVSRSGESRNGAGRLVAGSGPGLNAFHVSSGKRVPEDFSVSLYVGDRRLQGRALRVRLRGSVSGAKVRVVLVDNRGVGWGAVVSPSLEWQDVDLPLNKLSPCRWALLPQGYPGDWNYWSPVSVGLHKFDVKKVERLQLSLRRADGALPEGVDVESIKVVN